jgi:hypothetical protein
LRLKSFSQGFLARQLTAMQEELLIEKNLIEFFIQYPVAILLCRDYLFFVVFFYEIYFIFLMTLLNIF